MHELGFDLPYEALAEDADNGFDALMVCLAALRGLNGHWTLDLHQVGRATEVHPLGHTHYWWPGEGFAER